MRKSLRYQMDGTDWERLAARPGGRGQPIVVGGAERWVK